MKIITLLTGKIEPLGQDEIPSGINKKETFGPEKVLLNGFVNDEQADKKQHKTDFKQV